MRLRGLRNPALRSRRSRGDSWGDACRLSPFLSSEGVEFPGRPVVVGALIVQTQHDHDALATGWSWDEVTGVQHRPDGIYLRTAIWVVHRHQPFAGRGGGKAGPALLHRCALYAEGRDTETLVISVGGGRFESAKLIQNERLGTGFHAGMKVSVKLRHIASTGGGEAPIPAVGGWLGVLQA